MQIYPIQFHENQHHLQPAKPTLTTKWVEQPKCDHMLMQFEQYSMKSELLTLKC